MYFKRIEMHGFKSFAEPVVIEFDKGITCIVGPNGSGKSNISDAIRWVLGEQSPKMLRGGKMEDVIFAGTTNRKSRGMAEVTLVIDNTTGILPIEYQEVAITRRMYRSGESEYAVNNNQCRMKDIRELLMDTGIGVDGYSLIGQGKISEIISNKSDSIREIFEESAGIVSYRSKKNEAERKLLSSGTNMDRVNDIIAEIESRIGKLKNESEKAQEYVALHDRYKELQVNITINSIDEITEKNTIFQEDLTSLKKDISDYQSQKRSIENKIEKEKNEIEIIEQRLTECTSDLQKAKDVILSTQNLQNINKEKLTTYNRDILRLEEELNISKNKICDKSMKLGEIKVKKDEIAEECRQLSKELKEITVANEGLLAQYSELEQNIEDNKNDIFASLNEKSNYIAEKKAYTSLLKNLMQNESNLISSKDSMKKEIENLGKDIVDAKENKEKNLLKLEDCNRKLKKSKEDKLTLESELRDISSQIKLKSIEASQKNSRKKTIEEMENNYEGYNAGVKFVMKQKLNGISGVVAELMTVKKGYEIALETVLGSSIQNIICENERAAQNSIEKLKQNRAGRVTFLPLSNLKVRPVVKDSTIEHEKGFLGYGSECINFDEKYTKAFEYLLGNVAVIDNMTNALNISKKSNKNLRYVTLDGEIINNVGSVTGGKYRNKTANILERRNEVNELAQEIESLNDEIFELQRNEKLKENQLEELVYAIGKIESDVNKFEIANISFSKELQQLEQIFENKKEDNLKYAQSLSSIENEKLRIDEVIKNLERKIIDIDEKNKNLEEEIARDTGELESMKLDIQEAQENITEASVKLHTTQTIEENLEKDIKRVILEIEEQKQQQELKERELAEIRDNKMVVSSEQNDKEVHIQSAILQQKKLESDIEKIEKEKEEILSTHRIDNDVKEGILQKLSSLQSQKYEIDIKFARLDSQLTNLKEKLWEDFEISYAQALTMKVENFVVSRAVRENRDIKNRLKELGDVNVGAIDEYAQVSERYEFLIAQREDIKQSTDELKAIIDDMDKIIKMRFKESFNQIVANFENVFVEFFGGGHANIVLENEDDPLNSNIEITAQPPGKQLRNINLLSGGEKTMTAIALMFAVLKAKPTPCCILDEVEAALDEHNIHIFANYLKKFENIQFTLITHQKTTMEHADVMYGVTMPERGISKVYSLNMNDKLVN